MGRNKSSKPQRIPWRDAEVFGCPEPDCEFTHENEARVQAHIDGGLHRAPRRGATRPSGATEPAAEPEAGPSGAEDEESQGGEKP